MMKKKTFILAALAALTFLACSREEESAKRIDDVELVALTVSVPDGAFTKASSDNGEDAVSKLQVFVFRNDGALEATESANAATLTMSSTTGSKTVAALVNAPDLSVTTFDELESKVSDLADNRLGALVMYGSDEKEVTGDSSIDIAVTRLVAKIQIKKITNAITQAEYQAEAISIDRIFLLNAAGDALYTREDYSPAKWYNFKELEPSGPCDGLLHEVLSGKSLFNSMSLTEDHTFYCYANPTATDSSGDNESGRFTRLVVQTTIGGVTSYYPMSIPGILANHIYTVTELKITRLGSDDPDEPITTVNATFAVTVTDWENGTSTEFTI